MQKEYNFAVEEIKRIEFSDYDEQEFSIARLGYISTKPNSHGIVISEDCLRESAPSALGKWVVAKMFMGDVTTHEPDEHIVGMIPKEQEVEFVNDDDGYLRAYCDAIISKRYASDFCEIFEKDNNRAVSIEARFDMENEDNAKSFTICGVTVLGKTVRPSCPDSDIEFVRFSESEAEDYYRARHVDAASSLKQFVETRKQSMAEKKTYKVDKSKESMSNADWSEVDKADLRNKIMAASNRAKLVKDVYLLVESGWEDAPSEHLKYPCMELRDDTFIYNRNALASALSYAKQNDEKTVVNKIEKIYKKLDLDDTDGKEENMEEVKNIEMSETEIAENAEMAESVDEVKDEEVAAPDCENCPAVEGDSDNDDSDDETKMSEDEMMAKIAQLEKDIEERDNIIMERDTELADLRAFKQSVNEKERAMTVESVMCDIKDYVDNLTYNDLRDEGLACEFAALDAWVNKAKATCFGAVKKTRKNNGNSDTTVWGFSAPIEPVKKHTSIWE